MNDPTPDPDFDRALQQAKLESLKEFAYGAGHELNNPLANIASRAQTLLAGESDPERRRLLAAINTQAFRAHEMLADMMLFARPPKLALQQVDVVALARAALAELSTLASDQQTELAGPIRSDPLVIDADPVHLRVALRALCQNSLNALGHGGKISVDVQPIKSGGVQFVVTDTGPGVPADIRDKVFDPFFSGREAGRGLGFGLSKCWTIVTAHRGTIDVHSEPGRTEFSITLPTNQEGVTDVRA